MELMTKQSLFAGVAAFALLGYAGAAEASHPSSTNSVSDQTLSQSNTQSIRLDHAGGGSAGESGGAEGAFQYDKNSLPLNMGEHTFTHQVLDVNNFQVGTNQSQQGAISMAVSGTFNTGGHQ